MKNIENKLLEILLEENSKEDLIRKILDLNNPIKDDNIGPAGGIVFMKHDDGTLVECWTQDEPNLMTWDEARERVQTLNYGGSNDWSLPTKNESDKMFDNKNKIGKFQHDYYWSDTEYDESRARFQYFSTGNQSNLSKNLSLRVRAIRRSK